MAGSKSPLVERRDDPRVEARAQARFEAPYALWPQKGSAVIEEVSACGLRLRSEARLHPDEALVLQVPSEALHLRARVVWVRESDQSPQACIAGCRLQGDSIGKAKGLLPAAKRSRWAFVSLRGAFRIAILIALVALLVYLYWLFASLTGGKILH